MIKLNKPESPKILTDNSKSWTNDLMAFINKGEKAPDHVLGRYRHPEIKNVLKVASSEKCIYCESKVTQVYFGDVEHIKPKVKFPEHTYDWENLGFVCAVCNNNKGDDYDEALPYVNPFVEEPTDFLFALGTHIFHKPGNKRGELTEKTLDLNRPELIERRKERIDSIRTLADKYETEANASLKSLLGDELKKELEDDKPYVMSAKSLFTI